MLNSQFKMITTCIFILLIISSCSKGGHNKGSDKITDLQTAFIIDNDVNLYPDKESSDVKKNLSFFDSIVLLSDDVTSKGRIKVKLQDATEGWVEEKYTSYIPKNWVKLPLFENYYCYILTNKKIDIKNEDDAYGKVHYYMNSDFNVSMGLVTLKDYMHDNESKKDILENEIRGGRDKKLNWNREFILGNYKINYITTTDHPDGGISEMFDFARLNEMNVKRYYFITFDYQPYESKEKVLMQRKILFSTLQSLK